MNGGYTQNPEDVFVTFDRYELMYNKNDVHSAAQKIIDHIGERAKDWSWAYTPFDKSWERMLAVMEKGGM